MTSKKNVFVDLHHSTIVIKKQKMAEYIQIELKKTARCAVHVFSLCLSGSRMISSLSWWEVPSVSLRLGWTIAVIAWVSPENVLSVYSSSFWLVDIPSTTRSVWHTQLLTPLFFPLCSSCKTTIEAIHGLMSQVIKDKLFNQVNTSAN